MGFIFFIGLVCVAVGIFYIYCSVQAIREEHAWASASLGIWFGGFGVLVGLGFIGFSTDLMSWVSSLSLPFEIPWQLISIIVFAFGAIGAILMVLNYLELLEFIDDWIKESRRKP